MNEKKAMTLEEIHQEILVILKKIIEICDEININYYMTFGTLLGTIRHQNFIPWDDDCDVMMLRDNYNCFINYCLKNEERMYPYKIVCRENTKNYPFTIARFCDMRYKVETDLYDHIGWGLFVDIYPYDAVGNDPTKIIKKYGNYRKIMGICADYATSPSVLLRPGWKILRRILYGMTHIVGKDFFLDRLEELGKKYNMEESGYVACITWRDQLRVFKKEAFTGYKLMPFSNLKVKVPVDYEYFLSSWYGDYMKLPPEKDRKPSHGYRLFRKELEVSE